MTFPLDHVVINALFDMDDAAALMSRLGFTLTPRGYHSLGSINHLMVFEGHYLELVGLPLGTDVLRRDLLESPSGLNGLVFKSGDVDTCLGQLRRSGLTMLEAAELLPAGHDRRHRATRTVPDGPDGAGSVRGGTSLLLPALHAGTGLASSMDVACQWLQRHGRTGGGDFGDRDRRIALRKGRPGPAENRGSDVWTIDLVDAFRITLMSPARYRERYGELCVEANGRNSFFGAIVFKAADIGRIRDLAAPISELRSGTGEHSLTLFVPFLNTLLEFRSDR